MKRRAGDCGGVCVNSFLLTVTLLCGHAQRRGESPCKSIVNDPNGVATWQCNET